MHDVAIGELALSGIDDLSSRNGWVYRKQSQYILELVAEAECSTGLIEC
jgi:hypothetical protein